MKVTFYTLGCKVNSYESEALWALFKEENFTRVDNNEECDVCIINTCTVTNNADSKSRQRINNAIKNHPNAVIAVTGCYAQVKKDDIIKIDGVDIVLGNSEKGKMISLVKEFLENKKRIVEVDDIMKCFEYESLNSCEFEHTRAFLKIQDGCNNFCTYCLIPFARGPLRSRPHNDVISEVSKIVSMGYKEIVLSGIHTGGYNDNGYSFTNLICELTNIEELLRLRISSMEITQITDEFLNLLGHKNLALHLHLPIQSGSDAILKRMNRKYDKKFFIEKIDKIRELVPSIAISTDLIIGFPGETEEEFQETLETLKIIKFSKIHVFPYSRRDKTKAALMPNQIPNDVKKERVSRVLELDGEIGYQYALQFLEKEMDVIAESYKDGILTGHTSNFLKVEFEGDSNLIGEKVDIKIDFVDFDKKMIKMQKDSLQIKGILV